jgi:hypothetical protein
MQGLRAPLYVTAAERVLAEAMYPPTFTCWDDMDIPDGEAELDQGEFARFRNCDVAELLDTAHELAGFGCVDMHTCHTYA